MPSASPSRRQSGERPQLSPILHDRRIGQTLVSLPAKPGVYLCELPFIGDSLAHVSAFSIHIGVKLTEPVEPEDCAEAVLFLASNEASYITGQVLAVNGGMYT